AQPRASDSLPITGKNCWRSSHLFACTGGAGGMHVAPARSLMPAESRRAIHAAILGNLLIAASKFLPPAFTGSSGMIAEAVHSLVDTGDGALLLLGIRRSRRPPDVVACIRARQRALLLELDRRLASSNSTW